MWLPSVLQSKSVVSVLPLGFGIFLGMFLSVKSCQVIPKVDSGVGKFIFMLFAVTTPNLSFFPLYCFEDWSLSQWFYVM